MTFVLDVCCFFNDCFAVNFLKEKNMYDAVKKENRVKFEITLLSHGSEFELEGNQENCILVFKNVTNPDFYRLKFSFQYFATRLFHVSVDVWSLVK